MKRKTIIAALAAVLACLIAVGCTDSVAAEDRRFLSDGYGTAYVITDTHTGVQYMYYYYSHSGGLTVLVDADGKPLIQEGNNAD